MTRRTFASVGLILLWPVASLAVYTCSRPQVKPGTSSPTETEAAGRILSAQTIISSPQRDHAVRLHNQGVFAEQQGRFGEAESAFREALRAWETLPNAPPGLIGGSLSDLGNLLRFKGRYLEAERLLRRAISIEEKAGEPARLDLAFSLNSLGALYCEVREPARGTPLLERGLEIREQILGSEHPEVAASLDNLAEALIQRGTSDLAEALYRRALGILETQGEPFILAVTRCKLADLYFRKLRNMPQAEALYQQALDAWKRAPGRNHPQIGFTLTGLAEVYLAQRRYSAAEPLLKEALEIQEKSLGPAHPQVAKLLLDYASLLRKQHRQREAKPMEKRAKNIIKALSTEKQDLGTVDVSSLKRHR